MLLDVLGRGVDEQAGGSFNLAFFSSLDSHLVVGGVR